MNQLFLEKHFHSVYTSWYTRDNCSVIVFHTVGWNNPMVFLQIIFLNKLRGSFSWLEFS